MALTPKAFDLLVVLVENGGRLLEKQELLARVWPDQFVEEGSLSFNVSELRKALGVGQNGQHYIETVRKKGFRFVAQVEEIQGEGTVTSAGDENPALPAGAGEGEGKGAVLRATGAGVDAPTGPPAMSTRRRSPARKALFVILAAGTLGLLAYFLWTRRTVAPDESPPKTIAVLPFKPLSATERDEGLEMGMCDALIVRLGGLDQLIVRPTSSVVTYNGAGQDPLAAGRALGVDALLDGYIQRSGDRIRVTARLLRTADGKTLWSGQFNESLTDIFAVEDSISRQMAEALRLNLTGEEQRRLTRHYTDNVEAYELYLKGRYFYEKRRSEELNKSVGYFQQAIEKDPNYALAFAGMADSYVALAVFTDMPPQDSYRKAKAAATRALEIDDTIAEAHVSLGYIRYWYDWDWPGAESEFKRGIELSRNSPIATPSYAGYLMAMGRQAEALSEIKRSLRLAPLSLVINTQVARVFYFGREYDEAVEQCRKTLEIDPNHGGAHLFLGRAYREKGMYREALAELETARSLLRDSPEVLSQIGYTYAASGRRLEALRALQELQNLAKQRYVSPYHLAVVYAGLGERDKAFDSLERAYEDREGRMTILKLAPEFDTLRSDQRLTRLLQRMNLV